MDFDLTRAQKEIQWAAREFAKGEFDPQLALAPHSRHQFPAAIWKKGRRIGIHRYSLS